MEFIVLHKVEILAALFAISEVLAFIPQVESSGVFQAIYNLLKSLASKKV